MRPWIVAAVALVVGCVSGYVATSAQAGRLRADLETARSEAVQHEAKARLAAEDLAQVSAQVAALRADYDRLRDRVAESEARRAAAETAAETAEAEGESVQQLFENFATALESAPPAEPRRRTAPPDMRDDSGEPTADASMRREEWDARRREFAGRMRETMNQFLEDRIAASQDPAERQRLASIGEYADYMMELRDQMRAAETEEDRERVREAMGQAADTMRTLVQDQQNQVMRQALASQGVTDTQKQDEMLSAMREAQSSPFFRIPFGFGPPGSGEGGFGDGGRGRGRGR